MSQIRKDGVPGLSRLGFGCALLGSGPDRRSSLRLLGAAFDNGLTHFDVAPSYGMGVAEDVVGEFIAPRRDAITITTKVGLLRPRAPGAFATARAYARPLLAFAPALRRRLGRTVYKMSVPQAQFERAQIERSLSESLRLLRTERVDLLLLHEITPADVTDELRRFVEDAAQGGKIGGFGVGSPRRVVEQLLGEAPDLARTVQTNWAAGDAALEIAEDRPTITHGALRPLGRLEEKLRTQPGLRRELFGAAAQDRDVRAQLPEWLLAAALEANSRGTLLVSSRHVDRIAAAAALARDSRRIAEAAGRASALVAAMATPQG
jgi:D-threo-aldose 1-dehydrogenase